MFLMAATGCKWHWRIDQGNELENSGERAGIRTLDLLIKSQLLYRLSYALPKAALRPRNCGGT